MGKGTTLEMNCSDCAHESENTLCCLYNMQKQTDAAEAAAEIVGCSRRQKCCEKNFKGQHPKGRDTCLLHIKSTDLKT